MTDSQTTPSDSRTAFCADGSADVWRDRNGKAAPPPPEGAEYAAFLKDLLDSEEKRATAMETRAIAVITTSGTLVTLLLGLAALVTRVQSARIPGPALALAAVAAGFLVASALLASVANLPRRGWGLKPECLASDLWQRWGHTDDRPVAKVAATRLRLWAAAHDQTQFKALFVFLAGLAQAVGVLALAAAVATILLRA